MLFSHSSWRRSWSLCTYRLSAGAAVRFEEFARDPERRADRVVGGPDLAEAVLRSPHPQRSLRLFFGDVGSFSLSLTTASSRLSALSDSYESSVGALWRCEPIDAVMAKFANDLTIFERIGKAKLSRFPAAGMPSKSTNRKSLPDAVWRWRYFDDLKPSFRTRSSIPPCGCR